MLVYFSATGNTKHVVDEIKIDGEQVQHPQSPIIF